MKEKIERLSKGIFTYEMPELLVSEKELYINVEAGKHKGGSLLITNDSGQRMKGVIYVSKKILRLSRTDFIGAECEVEYEVNASALCPGEKHTGTINIVSDCGERQIPFQINITEPAFQSSIGSIRDLFQFTNLARLAWKEALELFQRPEFSKIVLQREPAYRLAYEQLLKSADISQALEEFLVLVHKKKACDFSVTATGTEYVSASENFMEALVVKKESWGYLNIELRAESPYILLQKEKITTEDFINGQAEIPFVVEAEKLKQGNYFTELVLSGTRKEIRVPITIKNRGKGAPFSENRRKLRRLECHLMELYLKFRDNRVSGGNYLSESERLLESVFTVLDKMDKEDAALTDKTALEEKKYAYELYRAYLSIVDGKNRGKEEACAVVFGRKSFFERNYPIFYCTVLYLEAMKSRDKKLIEEYVSVIRSYYEQEKKDDLLLWFLLYMDKHMESNRQQRLEAIKKHGKADRVSQLLAYEAAAVWRADAMTVTALGSFECQIMQYLLKHKLVEKEVALQFAYLSEKSTEKQQAQIWILKKLYEEFHHKEILTALCKKLMQNQCKSNAEHKYYKQAVRDQLRLDCLYEYYLMTIPKTSDQVIDQPVLLYFSMTDFSSEEEAAFLYSYVVRNKDNNPMNYRAYLKKLEQFAVSQMKKGVISEFHAVIYADVLRASIIDREMAQILPELIFTYQVECKEEAIQSICVAHKEENEVQIVPLEYQNGVRCALVQVYTENAELFFIDRQGRYFLLNQGDKVFRLLHLDNFLKNCYEIGSDNRKLLLHLWEKNTNYNRDDASVLELQKQVSQMTGVREKVKNDCLVALVEYYYDHYNVDLLESYLEAVDLMLLDAKDRERMLELMILRDMYDKVIECIEIFGCSTGMQAKRISRLCIRGISSPQEERDRSTLLIMAFFAFQNCKIEDRLLQYLLDRYNGTTEDMCRLWKEAKSRKEQGNGSREELEITSLEERLLAQILFAESYVEDSFAVFASYCCSGMNRKLIRAYFSYSAYKYFVNGRMTDPELFEMLGKEAFLESNQICVLALLKYYSEKASLTSAEKEFVNFHVQKLVQKKQIYGFYKKFEGKIALPAYMLDKYYIEYRANPKHRLVLHYVCGSEENDMQEEEMLDVGYGIFVKELILFYGENLQYFITEESEDGVEIVESRMINHIETELASGTTKYGKINEILLTQELQDEKTLFSLLEQYYKEEYAINRHFTPV